MLYLRHMTKKQFVVKIRKQGDTFVLYVSNSIRHAKKFASADAAEQFCAKYQHTNLLLAYRYASEHEWNSDCQHNELL